MDVHTLTKEDIRQGLDPAGVRTTAIIQAALVAGPLLFFLVVVLLHFTVVRNEPAAPGIELADAVLLLQVTGGVALLTWVGAYLVPNLMLNPKRLQACAGSSNPVDWMLNQHRIVTIIRLALTEGSALMGLTVMILAVMGKYLDANPVFWLGAVPLLIHLAFGMLTFPTRTSVVEFLDQRMLKPLQRQGSSP